MKTAWKPVAIGEVLERARTWNPSKSPADEIFEYIDLSSVDQDTKSITGAREISCGEAPSRARQIVASGDILVSTVRPNLNGVACVPEPLDGSTASTGFCVLRANKALADESYLFQWVKSPAFIADMIGKSTGASYPAVSDRIIFESQIPLPPLAEQKRIAGILDAADALRAKRRESLDQLDSLLQSTFLTLFGDPVSNPMGWEKLSLKEVGKVKTGGTPPSAKTGMFNGPIPFITPGDLESDRPAKRSVTEAGAAEAEVVRAGATLVCCIGATIGKMGRAAERSSFNQQINAVEWFDVVDDHFGLATLRFFKARIAEAGASTTLPILKKSSFEKIQIPIPPLPLQRRFAAIVESVERQKARQRAHLAELDALFAALQHRAFRGEL